jgi:tRNA nucleotidyltransferase (CCA-adding enzyme)
LEVQKADNSANNLSRATPRLDTIDKAKIVLNEIINQQQCFTLKDLKISGKDLIDLGIPIGPEIGKMLNIILSLVISDDLNNTREELISWVKSATVPEFPRQ